MKILCQRCREELEITKEQIEQVRKSIIGKISPIDYLDYFHNMSGRCQDKNKKHDFIWSLDFCEEIKKLIKENRDILGRSKAIELTETKVDESINSLRETINQLKQKLDEFEQKKSQLQDEKKTIQKEQLDLMQRVEILTGYPDITFWEKGNVEGTDKTTKKDFKEDTEKSASVTQPSSDIQKSWDASDNQNIIRK